VLAIRRFYSGGLPTRSGEPAILVNLEYDGPTTERRTSALSQPPSAPGFDTQVEPPGALNGAPSPFWLDDTPPIWPRSPHSSRGASLEMSSESTPAQRQSPVIRSGRSCLGPRRTRRSGDRSSGRRQLFLTWSASEHKVWPPIGPTDRSEAAFRRTDGSSRTKAGRGHRPLQGGTRRSKPWRLTRNAVPVSCSC